MKKTKIGSAEIVNYPFIHMTGHGNVVFSTNDVVNLRNYLTSGGFLHIDDNYHNDDDFSTDDHCHINDDDQFDDDYHVDDDD